MESEAAHSLKTGTMPNVYEQIYLEFREIYSYFRCHVYIKMD